MYKLYILIIAKIFLGGGTLFCCEVNFISGGVCDELPHTYQYIGIHPRHVTGVENTGGVPNMSDVVTL